MGEICIIQVGVLVNSIFFAIALVIPWAVVMIPIDQGYWRMVVPVTIGMNKCFTEPCIYHNEVFEVNDRYMKFDDDTREKFVALSRTVLALYTAGSALCLIAYALHVLFCCTSYRIRHVYPLSVVLIVMAAVVYFAFIHFHSYLHSGGLLLGSIMLLLSATCGMVLSTMYMTEINSKAFRYARIMDTRSHAGGAPTPV